MLAWANYAEVRTVLNEVKGSKTECKIFGWQMLKMHITTKKLPKKFSDMETILYLCTDGTQDFLL